MKTKGNNNKQFDELAQFKNFDAANKFMNVLLLLSGDTKDKWINARNDIMPNNKNPTEAHFGAVWTAFIINYGASNKTTKGLQDFLRKAKRPANMKLYNFKMRLYQLNKYLPLLPGPRGHHLNDANMFDTIQECVPDWSNSHIASNTTTKNINDLLGYYGKLEQQEAKRKPKTHCQDNSKLQQQPARNQNQNHQGNQNQCNGNNCCNEESFCSYHQLHGHSDAKCRDPHNAKGVMPTTPVTTNNKSATTETTKTIKTTNSTTTAIQHALSSKGKKATSNKKLPMTAANTQPTIPSPMMKSLLWKQNEVLPTAIKTPLPNKTMFQKLPLVYSPMSSLNNTSTSKP
jgi:hypothetical protein